MRRISVENAQLGMILARAVYDGSGTMIFESGTVLDVGHLPVLPRLEVREIIIHDSRVDDIIIVPLISEETEAHAVRLLHRMIDSNRGRLPEHVKLDIPALDRVIKAMIQGFYTVFMGEINTEGSRSLANFDYIHPVKVAGLSMLMGKEAGLSRADLINLGLAALLQNIGFINVPEVLLVNLDPEAQSQSPDYQKHVETGSQILRHQRELDPRIVEAVLHHEERWNGSGYNSGLRGNKICPFARIIAIASTYHSLISNRRNQKPISPPEAGEYISAYSGELFDPFFVQVFLKTIPFYPKGVSVKINTGEAGIVTDSNIGYIGRTKLRVCYGRNNLELSKPYDVDLSAPENQNIVITEILDY